MPIAEGQNPFASGVDFPDDGCFSWLTFSVERHGAKTPQIEECTEEEQATAGKVRMLTHSKVQDVKQSK
jgi:hypothetical protein